MSQKSEYMLHSTRTLQYKKHPWIVVDINEVNGREIRTREAHSIRQSPIVNDYERW